eukprot:g21077.t1
MANHLVGNLQSLFLCYNLCYGITSCQGLLAGISAASLFSDCGVAMHNTANRSSAATNCIGGTRCHLRCHCGICSSRADMHTNQRPSVCRFVSSTVVDFYTTWDNAAVCEHGLLAELGWTYSSSFAQFCCYFGCSAGVSKTGDHYIAEACDLLCSLWATNLNITYVGYVDNLALLHMLAQLLS